MKITCPQCDADIPQQQINVEKNIFFCPNCNEAFNLSSVIDQEEIAITEENINNPPKGVKVEKSLDGLTVRVYTRASGALFLIPFTLIFGGVSSFVLLAFLGIFAEEFGAGNINFASLLLVFPLASLFLALMTIYSIFGKVELIVGRSTSVFQGVGNIGIKRFINWENVKEISMHENVDSEGTVSKSLYIRENKTIKISVRFLNETKTRFLFSLLKYFRYETATQNKKPKIID